MAQEMGLISMKTDYPYLGQGRFMKTQTETETKHTPGPWTINPEKRGGPWYRIEAGENGWVAQVPNPDSANAALIAAAPAMLEALEQAVILLKHAWEDPALLHSQLADETAATMTEALEQATGKEL
jgi:hypothetical protein